MQLTSEQLAIVDAARGTQDLLIEAVAGSGKTLALLKALEVIPQRSILVMAYNNRIMKELEQRAPKMRPGWAMHIKTFHSVGRTIVKRHYPKLNFDRSGTEELIKRAAGGITLAFPIRRAATQLLKQFKETEISDGISLGDPEQFLQYGMNHDLFGKLSPASVDRVVEIVTEAYALGFHPENFDVLDFCDMLWLPIALDLAPPSRYQAIVVDECFVGDTPILLADKTTKTIREIIEQKLAVEVLSFDEASQQQVTRRVTDWKTIPRQKRMVRIKIQQLKRNPQTGDLCGLIYSRQRLGQRALVCTIDHKIYTTNRGWVEAGQLCAGDQVQVESEAPHDAHYNHKYKHSLAGKEKLARGLATREMPKVKTGGRPPIRGGNGQPLPVPHRLLLNALGDGWIADAVLPTKIKRGSGYPTNYKIDIANHECKIAIEVDGLSHRVAERRVQDAKKEAFLVERGWRVYRFDNQDVMRRCAEIAASIPTGCPVPGVVVDVEEHNVTDMLVYDLTIEGTHCYYAHGILVHNCQDMNEPQLALVRRLSIPTTRFIFAGDRFQAINSWRGADMQSTWAMMTERKAKVMTLTTSFRCSHAVIKEAREIVPQLNACADAPEGTVMRVGIRDVPRMLISRTSNVTHTFVLARANAPLLDAALYLWREGVRFQLNAGQEMLTPIFELLDKLDLRTPDLFRKSLAAWHIDASSKADVAGAVELGERIDEQRDMLLSAIGYVEPSKLRGLFETILLPGETGVLLSTVHKVKGLEAERVFLLRQTFRRHKPLPEWKNDKGDSIRVEIRKPGDAAKDAEETNIEYVAITRAKEHLIWVDIIERQPESPMVMNGGPTMIPQMLASIKDDVLEEEFTKAEAEMMRLSELGRPEESEEWGQYIELIVTERFERKGRQR